MVYYLPDRCFANDWKSIGHSV